MNIEPTALFSALSHETRLRCVLLIRAQHELCVCDLTEVTGNAQPNISRHLRQLREAGLVLDRRDGLWIHYRLNPALPAWVTDVLDLTAKTVARQHPFVADRQAMKSRLAEDGRCPEPQSEPIKQKR